MVLRLVGDLYPVHIPFWVNFVNVIFLFVFPLSFAYAVVKHRVMELPVLLKRSARYFVVERGFMILILAISVGLTIWFGQAFSRHFSSGSKAAIPWEPPSACCWSPARPRSIGECGPGWIAPFSAARRRQQIRRTWPQRHSRSAVAKGWLVVAR